MSSFFSLGRHKNTISPTSQSLQIQNQNLDSQSQPQPQSPPQLQSHSQPPQSHKNRSPRSRSSSTRRRLSKRLRLSSGSRDESLLVDDNSKIINNNKDTNLVAISTSPLKMTFASNAADAPAGAGSNATAAPATAASGSKVSDDPVLTDEQQKKWDDYNKEREELVEEEAAEAFDYTCRINATPAEKLANEVLLDLKEKDKDWFKTRPMTLGYGEQEHEPFPGDHYLTNVTDIQATNVLAVAKQMPKGAHLHIHYNACLEPSFLLKLAETRPRMFIMSDKPLSSGRNFFLSEISFSILSIESELEAKEKVGKTNKKPGARNLFSTDYHPKAPMPFKKFLDQFPQGASIIGEKDAMEWLQKKLVFAKDEAYDIPQTSAGAWARFNGRTRMMKGLFNYETAYVEYTKAFLEDLLKDKIQYAEIRPNFMPTNQLWDDDGINKKTNAQIVELIVNACEEFKAAHRNDNFNGIKIIYCTPRSFSRSQVKFALNECIAFKKQWPNYIAGFDLVGEEGQGEPLSFFVPEFQQFQEDCKNQSLDIPFLFHCGETLDMGTIVDGNLYDALQLKAKRIGHGFALPRHPVVLDKMKKQGVCVELCPISNEILGLTPRVSGHAMYDLLARNFPCTVNSDNGTLFQSSLSHDFYQVLIGKADMGLFGWRQLVEWSLEHSCFTPEDKEKAFAGWLAEWQKFVIWLLKTYGQDKPETEALLAELGRDQTLAAKPIPRSRL